MTAQSQRLLAALSMTLALVFGGLVATAMVSEVMAFPDWLGRVAAVILGAAIGLSASQVPKLFQGLPKESRGGLHAGVIVGALVGLLLLGPVIMFYAEQSGVPPARQPRVIAALIAAVVCAGTAGGVLLSAKSGGSSEQRNVG